MDFFRLINCPELVYINIPRRPVGTAVTAFSNHISIYAILTYAIYIVQQGDYHLLLLSDYLENSYRLFSLSVMCVKIKFFLNMLQYGGIKINFSCGVIELNDIRKHQLYL